jgi:hypothetical protein
MNQIQSIQINGQAAAIGNADLLNCTKTGTGVSAGVSPGAGVRCRG